VPADATSLWQLVRDSAGLDLNSPYAYLLICSDFAETSVVAEADGETLGFVAAYRPPPRPDCLFVWQVAVAQSARGRGLGSRLLDAALGSQACAGVRFLEATVTPGNAASRALFSGLARRLDAPQRSQVAFSSELFPDAAHEDEIRLRIGPFDPTRNRSRSTRVR
jgi:L-2,4-diaminobutyric acid acetyltransferase